MSFHVKRHQAGIALLLVLASPVALAQVQKYQFFELKGPSLSGYDASAINNAGQIVGSVYTAPGIIQAAIWQDNVATILSAPGTSSRATGINASGQVAGYEFDPYYGKTATVWSHGAKTRLATMQGSSAYTPSAINDLGQVAGSRAYGSSTQAILWNGFDITVLDSLGASSSEARGLNNVGQVAGTIQYNDTYGGRTYAVVWNGAVATVMQSPGQNECCTSAAAINDLGQVIGSASVGGDVQAVVWRNGLATVLNSPFGASYGFSINNVGQGVGTFYTPGGQYRAGVWNLQTGKLTDLNDYLSAADIMAGWKLTSAIDVNDRGDVIGLAFNIRSGNYSPYAMLAVPELGTAPMMMLGLVAGVAWLRRKRGVSH